MLSKRDLQPGSMQSLGSSLVRGCQTKRYSMGDDILYFLPLNAIQTGRVDLLGGGCSSAPLPLPGGAVSEGFLPVSPATLQLILPFAWAAHMAAIFYFLTVLHSLFISIHLCVIPCMSEIFLKSRIIPVVQIFPPTSYLTEYFHCYGKDNAHCISAMLFTSNTSTPKVLLFC